MALAVVAFFSILHDMGHKQERITLIFKAREQPTDRDAGSNYVSILQSSFLMKAQWLCMIYHDTSENTACTVI